MNRILTFLLGLWPWRKRKPVSSLILSEELALLEPEKSPMLVLWRRYYPPCSLLIILGLLISSTAKAVDLGDVDSAGTMVFPVFCLTAAGLDTTADSASIYVYKKTDGDSVKSESSLDLTPVIFTISSATRTTANHPRYWVSMPVHNAIFFAQAPTPDTMFTGTYSGVVYMTVGANVTTPTCFTFRPLNSATGHGSIPYAIKTHTDSIRIDALQVIADVHQIDDDSAAAENAEAFFDGTGYAGTGNTIPTVTTVTTTPNVNVSSVTTGAIDNVDFATAPGAAGGLQINGTNAGTTIYSGTTSYTGNVSYADGITITDPTTAAIPGLSIVGSTTSPGVSITGGPSNGAGLLITGGATNSNAITLAGTGTGHGLSSSSGTGATGNGANFVSLSTAGTGLNALGTTTGSGIFATGGASGAGLRLARGANNSTGMGDLTLDNNDPDTFSVNVIQWAGATDPVAGTDIGTATAPMVNVEYWNGSDLGSSPPEVTVTAVAAGVIDSTDFAPTFGKMIAIHSDSGTAKNVGSISGSTAAADSAEAFFLSTTKSTNSGAISGDATAADNLEAMLDGTGGVDLSLRRLRINSTVTDGPAISCSSSVRSALGLYTTATDLETVRIKAVQNGSGFWISGAGSGHGIDIDGGGSNGSGIVSMGYGSGSGIYAKANNYGHGILAQGSASGDGSNAFMGESFKGNALSLRSGGDGGTNPPAVRIEVIEGDSAAIVLSPSNKVPALDYAGSAMQFRSIMAASDTINAHAPHGNNFAATSAGGLDSTIVAQAAGAALTTYDAATGTDVTSTCGAGAGSVPDTIYVQDTSGTDAYVPSVSVSVYNSGQTALLAAGTTDANGRFVANLTANTTYKIIASLPGYTLNGLTETIVAGRTWDTAYVKGYNFDVGAPSAANLKRISGYEVGGNGEALEGIGVTATLTYKADVTEIPRDTSGTGATVLLARGATVTATSDATGYWYIDLRLTSNLLPAGGQWVITAKENGGRGATRWSKTITTTTTAALNIGD